MRNTVVSGIDGTDPAVSGPDLFEEQKTEHGRCPDRCGRLFADLYLPDPFIDPKGGCIPCHPVRSGDPAVRHAVRDRDPGKFI